MKDGIGQLRVHVVLPAAYISIIPLMVHCDVTCAQSRSCRNTSERLGALGLTSKEASAARETKEGILLQDCHHKIERKQGEDRMRLIRLLGFLGVLDIIM